MTDTQNLIDDLVRNAAPVRRLRAPLLRAAFFLGFALAVLGLLAIVHGFRGDLALRLHDPLFLLGMAGALLTGVLAAIAAFRLSLPEASAGWLLLPAPALVLWLSSIGYGCLTDWVRIGPDGMRMGEAIRCFATLLLTSVPLSVAMLVMLRFAAYLSPTRVSAVGGLAVAALTAFAVSLFHNLEASAMILMWNFGVAAIIAGAASLGGRRALSWSAAHLAPPASRKA